MGQNSLLDFEQNGLSDFPELDGENSQYIQFGTKGASDTPLHLTWPRGIGNAGRRYIGSLGNWKRYGMGSTPMDRRNPHVESGLETNI